MGRRGRRRGLSDAARARAELSSSEFNDYVGPPENSASSHARPCLPGTLRGGGTGRSEECDWDLSELNLSCAYCLIRARAWPHAARVADEPDRGRRKRPELRGRRLYVHDAGVPRAVRWSLASRAELVERRRPRRPRTVPRRVRDGTRPQGRLRAGGPSRATHAGYTRDLAVRTHLASLWRAWRLCHRLIGLNARPARRNGPANTIRRPEHALEPCVPPSV